jgi:hypothetical protein
LATGGSEPAGLDAELFNKKLSNAMRRLETACGRRGAEGSGVETAACQAAWSIARLVCGAGLEGVRLPRNYAARVKCGENYLSKYLPSDSTDHQALFSLARRDSIVGRMDPLARNLSGAQVNEFVHDLEEGLIDEIADFIEYCNANDAHAVRGLAGTQSDAGRKVRSGVATKN